MVEKSAPVKRLWPRDYGREVTEQLYKVFLVIEVLTSDNFTGSYTLHMSEGEIRKTETNEVERIN